MTNLYSVKVGTIFEGTHIELKKWFLAIAIITNVKKGMSSRELARQLNVNKDTAWCMQMKIREAMNDADQMARIKHLDSYIQECTSSIIIGKISKCLIY